MIRYSLAFLWIFTAITSVVFGYDQGVEILAQSTIDPRWFKLLIYSGALLDGIIGVWLLTGKFLKINACLQIIVILVFTILITWLVPFYWLHPFGPVTKNIPIIVLNIVWQFDNAKKG